MPKRELLRTQNEGARNWENRKTRMGMPIERMPERAAERVGGRFG